MALLSSKPKSFIGVDLGESSVKVVELKNAGGRPQLVTYGFAEQSTDVAKGESPETKRRLIDTLKDVLKKARVTTLKTVAALPSYSVFSSIISLPQMSKKELESAVTWEAKKFVPMPLEEMNLAWVTLNEPSKEQVKAGPAAKKNIRVLLTAAPKNLVSRYIDIFKAAGLELVGLETEAFALERSLIGHDKSAIMIIDFGALATSIMVFAEGVPLLNRSIDVGGDSITNAIVNAMNIDPDRAEQFKRDFGLASASGSSDRIPKTIEFAISSIVNEIRYVLNIYQQSGQGKPVEKIILTGGSAFLVNLPAYLEKIFNLKTYVGDPWSRIIYPVELKAVLDEIGPRLAVSVGLAMREVG